MSGRRRTDAERLEELAGRKRAIDARMQAIRARAENRRRREDTRRKVLAGALVLHRAEGDGDTARRLRAWLARELPGFVRERDMRLFDGILTAGEEGGRDAEGKGGAEEGNRGTDPEGTA